MILNIHHWQRDSSQWLDSIRVTIFGDSSRVEKNGDSIRLE